MNGTAVLQLLGSLGLAGVATAAVNAIFNRRKLSADATKVINEAASTAVERVEGDNTRLRIENTASRLEIRSLERDKDLLIDVVRAQHDFGIRAAQAIRALGGEIEGPPDLPRALLGLPED